MKGFEIYENGGFKCKAPRICLGMNNIVINKLAADECKLNGYSFVSLGYNAETNQIALFPEKKGSLTNMKMLRRNGGARHISIIGFMERYGLLQHRQTMLEYTPSKQYGEMVILNITNKPSVSVRLRNSVNAKNKKKTTAPIKPKKTMGEPETPKKQAPKTDYACIDCGETNVAWKYKESFKPDGHPKVCPKCHCPDFEEVKE